MRWRASALRIRFGELVFPEVEPVNVTLPVLCNSFLTC